MAAPMKATEPPRHGWPLGIAVAMDGTDGGSGGNDGVVDGGCERQSREPKGDLEPDPPTAPLGGPLRQARPSPSIDGWRVLKDLRARLFGR